MTIYNVKLLIVIILANTKQVFNVFFELSPEIIRRYYITIITPLFVIT